MIRTLALETNEKIGQEVLLKGWVDSRRDHGKLVFFDLRDRSGLVQIVAGVEAGDLRDEFVVAIEGVVNSRPERMVNPDLSTGTVEVKAEKITVIAKAKDLPFPIGVEGSDIDEELRLKYRYLDLRRPRLRQNLKLRHQVIKFMHQYMDEKGFMHIETPIITKATPEGARDFLVPARLQPGKFYALPQSPQQYKQLLMVAGVEKYYQIVRCFRDEDPRADRAYGEFTQLDIEISFTTQEEIREVVEDLYTQIAQKFFPDKKITQVPFPIISFAEAMAKYGSDRPDVRKDKNDPNELGFCWVVDFPLFEWKPRDKRWGPVHHPFTAPKTKYLKQLFAGEPEGILADQYDFVLNGYEIGGGSIRITDPAIQEKVFEILGHSQEETRKKFGHLLEAFEYGVPPHGGIAPGIDRFLMAALGEKSIREVIAFPSSASGKTAVMEAPSEVDPEQLKELGIKVDVQKDDSNQKKKIPAKK